MIQIKTIYRQEADVFDEKVNAALAEGWTLIRRTFDDRGFLAELERTIISEAERGCNNCKHGKLPPEAEPCIHCEDGPQGYPTKWEAVE